MDELVNAAWTTGITLVVVFAVALVVGFGLLFRRGRKAGRAAGHPAGRAAGRAAASVDPATQRANILLVRADDAVCDAEDELGFAVAQFGANATADLSRALTDARRRVMEAFALQQRLDDHVPDTGLQRREWTARIMHLCETAQAGLTAELRHFDALRALDRNAPANLAALRAQLAALETRRSAAIEAMATLHKKFAAPALTSVSDNIDQGADALAAGIRAADAADSALGGEPTISMLAADDDAVASENAIDAIREGEEHARRATHLFAAIDTLAQQLGTASKAMVELVDSTRANLAEARAVRDDAADAAAGASVNAAVARTEATLAAVDAGDPVAALDRLRDANALLDTSLAGARNQRRRLEGARAALEGALISARSQLSATRDFIATRRGGVGSEARTRLAEGERLLKVAEVETDPVLALDTARSAATYARDADALARYDVQH